MIIVQLFPIFIASESSIFHRYHAQSEAYFALPWHLMCDTEKQRDRQEHSSRQLLWLEIIRHSFIDDRASGSKSRK